MTHNKECPKCGNIAVWNWAKEKELLTMPNGEQVLAKVIVKDEPPLKCQTCGYKFEPLAHAKLAEAFDRVARKMES